MKKHTIIAITSLFLAAGVSANEVGKKLYTSTCSACHQPTGAGLPPAFPALKGSEMVNDEDASKQINIVLNGKSGTAMLPFNSLSDDDLAAIISYTRTSWDNTGGEVTAEQIKAARK